MKSKLKLGGYFLVTCYKPDGSIRWQEKFHNVMTDVGITDILEQYFNGSSYTATHYGGLASSSPTFAVGDTMSSHAGWSEVTSYNEANRPTFSWDTAASKSIDNSTTPVTFTINTTVTVGGIFISTNNTKGGTTGVLVCGEAFNEGNRAAVNNDVISVVYTISGADS